MFKQGIERNNMDVCSMKSQIIRAAKTFAYHMSTSICARVPLMSTPVHKCTKHLKM